MMVFEIAAIRKGHAKGYKTIELHVVGENWSEADGPHLKGNISLEASLEDLDDMFGAGYDLCDRFELVALQFTPAEEEEE